MGFTGKTRILMATGLIIALTVGVAAFVAFPLSNSNPADDSIKLTLLYNAGVMIETDGMRIYIDPYNLPDNYTDLPADIILITHPHGDHYDSSVMDMLQKNETVNVFPANMSLEIIRYDGVGVNPGDQLQFGSINITAFYMYTWAPEGYEPSHPRENNWTSYIIDIDGFKIFHAGDSKNIEEYEMLTGQIDIALLPLGPGCQTMFNMEVVEALEVIQPRYFIPIHYEEGADATFITIYGSLVEQNAGCEIVHLAYYESHTFQPGENGAD